MKKVDSKRATVFIVVFATLATIVNSLQTGTPREKAAVHFGPLLRNKPQVITELPVRNEVAVKKAAQDEAEEQAKFISRYLNLSPARKPNAKTIAVVAVTEDGTLNRSVNNAIVNRLNASSAESTSSLFKLEFVSDGLFSKLFSGSSDIISKLKLGDLTDSILLARQNVHYTENVSLQNVLTASMQLEFMILPVAAPDQARTWTLTVVGPGFDKKTARINAEERLIKQIQEDPRMSLNQ